MLPNDYRTLQHCITILEKKGNTHFPWIQVHFLFNNNIVIKCICFFIKNSNLFSKAPMPCDPVSTVALYDHTGQVRHNPFL